MEPELQAADSLLPRRTVLDVDGPTRGLLTLAGMSGLAAGATAVFESTNQAGSVALLAVGAVASLLALVGKVPLRWVIGGHEFDMSEQAAAAQEAVDAMTDQLDPRSTAELAERLANAPLASRGPLAAGMAAYVAFEQATIGRVMQLISPLGWTYEHASTSDRGVDGFVVTPVNERIPIEYKYLSTQPSRQNLIQVLLRQRLQEETPDSVMVVGTTPQVSLLPRGLEPELPIVSGLELLDAGAPDFDRNFIAACDAILQRMRNPSDS